MQTTSNRIQDPARAKAYFEDKIAFTTGPVEVSHMIEEGESVTIVDVREAEDYAKGHVPGAINLPRGTWNGPTGLTKDKTNIVYCYTQTCHLAANACVVFAGQGYAVMELEGGFEGWKEHDLEVDGDGINRLKKAGERLLHRRQ